MILLHRQGFDVARYYKEIDPEAADSQAALGPVLAVELTFELWLGGQPVWADAFFDIGADHSVISYRWIRDRSEKAGEPGSIPQIDPSGFVDESISVAISGHRLSLGEADLPVWVGAQGGEGEDLSPMPGFEDVLLGRDFMTRHGLLMVADGEERSFSLLLPADGENRRRREEVHRVLRPGSGAA